MTFPADHMLRRSTDLAIFDGATDLMCVRDMQGRLVRVNRAWQDTLGLSVDEVVNTPLLPLVHPADVPATLLRMTEADRCERIVNFVNRYRRKDGSYRYMEWRAQRLGDVILGRARDVTSLRLRQSELAHAQQALADTLANLGDRALAPADEIMKTVQALGRTALTPTQRDILHRMGRAVETLGDAVAQLVERERAVAWSTFLPAFDRHRSVADDHVSVDPSPEAPLLVDSDRSADGPSALAGPGAPASWIVDTLNLIDEHRLFASVFRDLPSQTLGLLCIYLDHAGQLYSRRLQSLAVGSGLMSAGRAAALLARMQDTGFVDCSDELRAGQAQRYRVSPALVGPFARQLIVNLQSMAATNYKAVVALEWMGSDDKRARVLLARQAEAVVRRHERPRDNIALHLNGVLLSAQGQSIALSIARAAMEKHGPTWEGWVDVSLTSYAERFSVSLVHARRVIKNLEASGVLRDPAIPSRLFVTDRFRRKVTDYWRASYSPLGLALDGLV